MFCPSDEVGSLRKTTDQSLRPSAFFGVAQASWAIWAFGPTPCSTRFRSGFRPSEIIQRIVGLLFSEREHLSDITDLSSDSLLYALNDFRKLVRHARYIVLELLCSAQFLAFFGDSRTRCPRPKIHLSHPQSPQTHPSTKSQPHGLLVSQIKLIIGSH